MQHAKVAVIEDHVLQRTYTTNLIQAQPDMEVVYAGDTLPDFLTWLKGAHERAKPHLILLDLMAERRPNADPVVVKTLISTGFQVLVFSAMASPPLVRRMLDAGIHGIIGKRDSEEELITAIRLVLRGEAWMSPELAEVIAHDPQRPRLSDQEERALVLYSSGLSLDDVASAIGVQPGTAKKYLQRVRAKYANTGRPMDSRVAMSRIASVDGYLIQDSWRAK